MIFLSLRFYVKSILVILKSEKSAFLTHLKALNFDFYAFLQFLNSFELDQIYKIQSPENGKNGSFTTGLQILQN